jgi:hypothetical protein
MNDVHDDIRQMLQEKANEVPAHLEVPASLTKRVGPRIVRNGVILAATAAVVIAVAVAGLRSVQRPSDQSLGTGTPTPSGVQMCSADDLGAELVLEGAMGSRDGTIDLTNLASDRCTLQGTPRVEITDSDLHAFDSVDVSEVPPNWKIQRAPEPDGWPVVSLGRDDVAVLRFAWSNWCENDASPRVSLTLADGTHIAVVATTGEVPPCNGGQGSTSTVQIGPFEPAG